MIVQNIDRHQRKKLLYSVQMSVPICVHVCAKTNFKSYSGVIYLVFEMSSLIGLELAH